MKRLQAGLLTVLVVLAACSETESHEAQHLPRKILELGGQSLTVQVADDVVERERGLMFVRSMPEREGMLFVWPEAQPRSFWMKNTYIPLDIIYLDAGKVVSIVPWAKPFDETGLPSGYAADMVLEVNGGWAAAHKVSVGSEMQIKQ